MSQRRAFLVTMFAIATALAVTSCAELAQLVDPNAAIAAAAAVARPTTVLIIRHAERDPGLDPPLNAEGVLRAAALREALANSGLTAIYCTDSLRNRQTVEGLAADFGLTPNLVSPLLYVDVHGTADTLAQEMLTRYKGGVILFCGNIGTTGGADGINKALFARFDGVGRPPERYSDMFIGTIEANGTSHFIIAQYGGPSSLD